MDKTKKTQLYINYYIKSLKKKVNNSNDTLLTFFVKNGDTNTCEKLLEYGEDVNQPNKNGDTPLLISIQEINYDMTKLLLKHGANVNITKNDKTLTPIQIALQSFYFFDYTIEIDFGPKTKKQITMDKLYLIIQKLLENNAKIDFYSNYKIKFRNNDDYTTELITPLEYSVKIEDQKLFKLLLKYSNVYEMKNLFYEISSSFFSDKFLYILYYAKININVLFINSLNRIIYECIINGDFYYDFHITNMQEYVNDPELILFTELLNYSKKDKYYRKFSDSILEKKDEKILNLVSNIIKPSKDENISFGLYYRAICNEQYNIIEELYKKGYNINAKINNTNFLLTYMNNFKYLSTYLQNDIVSLIKYGIKEIPEVYYNLYPLLKYSIKIVTILHSLYSKNKSCLIKQIPLDCIKILYKMLINLDEIELKAPPTLNDILQFFNIN